MADSYRRLDDRRLTLPSLFSKRPRSDFDVSSGHDLPGYFGLEERTAHRFIGDSDSIGASYDRYMRSAQISLYGGGGSTKPLTGGLSGHPIDDPRMIGIEGSDPMVTTKSHSIGLGGGRSLPPNASSTLFVEGLPANCTRREVSHIFRPFVGYKEVRLVTKEPRRSGDDPLVLCFVDFASPAHAATAMDALQVIKDQAFVLSECVDGVGPTEDAVRTSIAHGLHLTNQYRFSETVVDENSQIWEFRLVRLKLLQFRDKLETFLGINMGRFSVQEYSKFRIMPINEAAVTLAESGKIGALNLLFKRHPYSLTPFMLEILAAIPETVPVQSYGQLLPGAAPPSSVALREKDWVECQEMVTFISRLPENHEISIQLRTEPIMKQCVGFSWPSTDELSMWYRNRARDMDSFSGQLGNCLSLVDFACRKGIYELQQFHEDISYLHQLIYSDDSDDEVNFTVGLVAWKQLSDYEKFKMMLKGVKEENMVKRLRGKAIPFMQNKFHIMTSVSGDAVMDGHSTAADEKADSFLVKWLKEIASENKLDLCLKVIEDGCRDFQSNSFFRTKVEAADCSLQCIYLCTVTDRWTTMASILSKLPEMRDSEIYDEGLKKRLKLAEGHIEAGRLLSFYQSRARHEAPVIPQPSSVAYGGKNK